MRHILVLAGFLSFALPAFAQEIPEDQTSANQIETEEQGRNRAAQAVNTVREELQGTQIVPRTVATIDVMLRVGAKALRKKGYPVQSEALLAQWRGVYKPMLGGFTLDSLGDHAPFSRWLMEVTTAMEVALGTSRMKLLHLDDLYIVNYAIPVVFDPANIEWDLEDYTEHFVPFAGVVGYWAASGGCSLAITNPLVSHFTCGIVGTLAEEGMKAVSPSIANKIYQQFNP